MEQLARKYITSEEYIALERESDTKHEYYRGEIFAMSGASEKHNIIVSNLIAIIHGKLKSKPCLIYPSDIRVVIDPKYHYTYPDVTIVCGERRFLDTQKDSLLNPTVILEVLSDSTESYDRGKKFEAYRKILSLQEYVLVSVNRKNIDIYTKSEDGRWFLNETSSTSQPALHSIDILLNLEDVYDKVEWDSGEIATDAHR